MGSTGPKDTIIDIKKLENVDSNVKKTKKIKELKVTALNEGANSLMSTETFVKIKKKDSDNND